MKRATISLALLLSTLLVLTGCGASDTEKRLDSVLNAIYYIEQGECDKAITELEGVGRDLTNFEYVEALASAYACKAGYTTPGLFADITSTFGTPSILGGLTKFTNSPVSVNPDSDVRHQALADAINVLLYAGNISASTEPTTVERAKYFTTSQAGDINSFLFYLVMEQVGRYAYWYGNSSSTGVKGSGTSTNSNSCLFNYDSTIAGVQYDANGDGTNEVYTIGDLLFLTDQTAAPLGACSAVNNTTDPTGHPDMGVNSTITATQVARLCEGVVLMNVFFDTISGVLSGVGGTLGTIDTTLIDEFKGYIDATVSGGTSILNQANCETNYASNTDNLQIYFVLVYETLLQ